MSTRFHKKINVVPGLSVNVGKKGASISVGGPGLKKTYSRNGVRTTVGIPGSGLSHTTYKRYDANSSNRRIANSYSSDKQSAPIRTRKENRLWGTVFLILVVVTVIACFAVPNIIEFGRWFIAILGGGFFLIGAVVFFSAKSKEDFESMSNYLENLQSVGGQLEETQKLLDEKLKEKSKQ